MPQNFLLNVVVSLVPMILSLSVHEFAHAWVAHRLGDDTAARQGRMTLSPLSHIDIFGTILVPLFMVFQGGIALIGWAKPVPVNPVRFRRDISMRSGMILTAVAGPLSNLALAVLAIAVYALVARLAPSLMISEGRSSGTAMLLRAMFMLNIGLFVFNLVPLPPLDGSRLLPRSMDGFVSAVAPYSFILVLVVINFFPLILYWPIMRVSEALQVVFQTPIAGGRF